MNNSGAAVQQASEYKGIAAENILVVCDDFHVDFGHMRLRSEGSDGGHNGLYSIIYHLQSNQFPRLRCGVASESMPKNKREMTAFVLSPFEKDEKEIVQQLIHQASDAALTAVTEGIATASNRFNTKKI